MGGDIEKGSEEGEGEDVNKESVEREGEDVEGEGEDLKKGSVEGEGEDVKEGSVEGKRGGGSKGCVEGKCHYVVVNVSPITYGHSLLVPEPHSCLPQVGFQCASFHGNSHKYFPIGIDRG